MAKPLTWSAKMSPKWSVVGATSSEGFLVYSSFSLISRYDSVRTRGATNDSDSRRLLARVISFSLAFTQAAQQNVARRGLLPVRTVFKLLLTRNGDRCYVAYIIYSVHATHSRTSFDVRLNVARLRRLMLRGHA